MLINSVSWREYFFVTNYNDQLYWFQIQSSSTNFFFFHLLPIVNGCTVNSDIQFYVSVFRRKKIHNSDMFFFFFCRHWTVLFLPFKFSSFILFTSEKKKKIIFCCFEDGTAGDFCQHFEVFFFLILTLYLMNIPVFFFLFFTLLLVATLLYRWY